MAIKFNSLNLHDNLHDYLHDSFMDNLMENLKEYPRDNSMAHSMDYPLDYPMILWSAWFPESWPQKVGAHEVRARLLLSPATMGLLAFSAC
jgi:hypothetical protein